MGSWPSVTGGLTQKVLASQFNSLSQAIHQWLGSVSAAGFGLTDLASVGYHTTNVTWQEWQFIVTAGASQAADTLALQRNTRTSGAGADTWVNLLTVSGAGALTVAAAANFTGGLSLNGVALAVFGASGASHSVGLVPDPGTTAGSTRYLREDGSWAAVIGTSAVWGSITGTLSSQTDLATALAAKQNSLTFGNLAEATSAVLTITNGTGAVVGANVGIQVKQASGTQSGYLSSADWTAFSGKQGALTLGNVTEATSAVLTIAGGSAAVIGSGLSIQVKQATNLQSGYLSSADWSSFNSKQNALTFGNVTEATSSVLTITGGTGAVIGAGVGIQVKQATNLQSGYLSSTDWVTFNGKQSALTLGNVTEASSAILTITGGSGAVIGSGVSIQVKQATTTQSGYLSSADWNTFSGKQNTLTIGNLTEATSAVLTIIGGTGAVIGSGVSVQVKQASGTVSGYLSSTDWSTFNSKQPGHSVGNLTETTSSVLTITGGTGAVIGTGASIQVKQATSLVSGYLSSADWTTFNSKQSPLTLGNVTEVTSAVLTLTGGTGAVVGSGLSIQVKQASGTQSGYLSSTDYTSFASKQAALTLPLSIAQGGTGQTAAAAALTALGGASLTAANTFSAVNAFNGGTKSALGGTAYHISVGQQFGLQQFWREDPVIKAISVGLDTNGNLTFSTWASSAWTYQRMTFANATGALLIGTTADNGTDKLQVTGSVNVSGAATFGGTVALNGGGTLAAALSCNGYALNNIGQMSFSTGTVQINGPGNVNVNNTWTFPNIARSFSLSGNGGTAGWYKLGTVVFSGSGHTFKTQLQFGWGFNSNGNQQSSADIVIRAANGAAAPNLSGASVYINGHASAITQIKLAATGASTSATNNSWDVYLYLGTFTTGDYSVQVTPNIAWTDAQVSGATDPGVASTSVVVGTVTQIIDRAGVITLGTQSGAASGPTLNLNGSTVTGAGTFSGNMSFGASVSIANAGNLSVGTYATFTSVVGGVSLTGSLNVSGTLTTTGGLTLGSGGMSLNNQILAGDANLSGNITSSGTLTVSALTIASAGYINLNGQSVTGNGTYTGISTFSNIVNLNGSVVIGAGGMNLNGQTISGAATFSGALTFGNAVTASGGLTLGAGGMNLNGQTVSGAGTFSGAHTFGSYIKFSNTAADANDGKLGNGILAPGLDIIGINPSLTYRKIQVWGEITQNENGGTNTWLGNNSFPNNDKLVFGNNFGTVYNLFLGGSPQTPTLVNTTDSQFLRVGPIVFVKLSFSFSVSVSESYITFNPPVANVGALSILSCNLSNSGLNYVFGFCYINGSTIYVYQSGYTPFPAGTYYCLISGWYRVT